ncbi:hypothetical protein [Aeromicrobium sp. 9AM]|uniref:hypothetical protein n=1 Tax=Aeromicrobium sp. 9AM TaxID=2653126 RepID=UPI001359B310|nr:hypothetical protein [Aeromicrobium sp. 9AM]
MSRDLRDEVLYGRDVDHARIFISSKMDGTLDAERSAAVDAVSSVTGHRAWWWERDAPMGVLHSVEECAKFAHHSDGLILLVGGPLSDVIFAEYFAARDGGAERYILIRQADVLPDDVEKFISAQHKELVTRKFANIEELKSHIFNALRHTQIRALRHRIVERIESGGGADGG